MANQRLELNEKVIQRKEGFHHTRVKVIARFFGDHPLCVRRGESLAIRAVVDEGVPNINYGEYPRRKGDGGEKESPSWFLPGRANCFPAPKGFWHGLKTQTTSQLKPKTGADKPHAGKWRK